jgi:hypothetical protein
MRDTFYSAIVPILMCLTTVMGVLAASPQQPSASAGVTLLGCLVDEREFANAYGLAVPQRSAGVGRQLVIVVDGGRGSSGTTSPSVYALTGPEENRLSSDVHRRVSLEGVIEPGTVVALDAPEPLADIAPTPTGAVGVTQDGSPAHEPTDAVVSARDGARARRPDERPASTSELDRINVTAARALGESCGESFVQTAIPEPALVNAVSATRVPSTGATRATATLTGCLVRRDDDGSAPSDSLILLAAPRDDRSFLTRGAVPGSLPSGGGSGTVGTSGAVARELVAYRLTGEVSGLTRYVGQRIEATGIADPVEARVTQRADTAATEPARAEGSADTAHPTAVHHTLEVTSFRTAAGVCR